MVYAKKEMEIIIIKRANTKLNKGVKRNRKSPIISIACSVRNSVPLLEMIAWNVQYSLSDAGVSTTSTSKLRLIHTPLFDIGRLSSSVLSSKVTATDIHKSLDWKSENSVESVKKPSQLTENVMTKNKWKSYLEMQTIVVSLCRNAIALDWHFCVWIELTNETAPTNWPCCSAAQYNFIPFNCFSGHRSEYIMYISLIFKHSYENRGVLFDSSSCLAKRQPRLLWFPTMNCA